MPDEMNLTLASSSSNVSCASYLDTPDRLAHCCIGCPEVLHNLRYECLT